MLGACLINKRCLKRLSLRENELEDAGAVEIARSQALNPALESLDLSANQVCSLSLSVCRQDLSEICSTARVSQAAQPAQEGAEGRLCCRDRALSGAQPSHGVLGPVRFLADYPACL